jgi:hypothetical protein
MFGTVIPKKKEIKLETKILKYVWKRYAYTFPWQKQWNL